MYRPNVTVTTKGSVYVVTAPGSHDRGLRPPAASRLTLVYTTHLHLRSRYRYATNRLVEASATVTRLARTILSLGFRARANNNHSLLKVAKSK